MTRAAAPLEIRDQGPTRELVLNRPARRNALSHELIAQLHAAVEAADSDGAVRCLLLTGAPPAFCAGLDLEDVAAAGNAVHDTSALLALYAALESCGKPTLAAVNGSAAAGGAGLVCVCDIVVAGSSATLGYPGIRRGLVAPVIMPGLVRQVGPRMATYLLLTGAMLSAEHARRCGLVSEVVPDGEVVPHARALAGALGEIHPGALCQTKALLRTLRDIPAGPLREQVRALARTLPGDAGGCPGVIRHSQD